MPSLLSPLVSSLVTSLVSSFMSSLMSSLLSSLVSCRRLQHPGAVVRVPPGEDGVWPAPAVQLEGVPSLPAGRRAVEGRHGGPVRHLQRQHPGRLPVSVGALRPPTPASKRELPFQQGEREVMVKCSLSLSLCNAHWPVARHQKPRLNSFRPDEPLQQGVGCSA